ncbi:hypothetical protein I302_107540 [Kwoniella bestiolae CBS 10118]|uniref:Uncharacterized protein n=1 Tax=Kwoniella bestiolae CBS 10118 TaxID=1296100 RepID=A0A1B9FY93_9TREE|nr:hypothetical protein I302_06719 [Kwoniella bestiolae CBS 10118]OCF23735.1 hypothetical protein I302_06719 [Kwoniella bestiolae CBS 10118]
MTTTVTSPGNTVWLPCPTPRARADQGDLSNAKRMQLGLPLATPHIRNGRASGKPSCTFRHVTKTEVMTLGPTEKPPITSWITVRTCAATRTIYHTGTLELIKVTTSAFIPTADSRDAHLFILLLLVTYLRYETNN